jgi:hypothetical protein
MSNSSIPSAAEKFLVDQNLAVIQTLKVGETNWYSVTSDTHYRIVSNLQTHILADDLSVTRVKDDLVISYADGTNLVALNYFTCGVEEGEPDTWLACSLTIAADTPDGYSVPAGAGGHATPIDIVYHHGDQSAFKLMLQQSSISDELAFAQTLESQAEPALGAAIIPLWAPLAGGAAVLGSLGSSPAAINTPLVVNKGFLIVGSILLGPVIDTQDLQVKAYKQDGSELAAATVSDDGTYKLISLEDYQGLVLVKVIDTNTGKDFLDEATGTGKNLITDLRAVTYIDTAVSNSFYVSVNPVTETAVRDMGLASGKDGKSSHDLTNLTSDIAEKSNKKIAKFLGIDNVDIITDTAVSVIDTDNNANTSANSYGKLLAALSGMGATKQASVSAIIDLLIAGMSESGITDTLKLELMSGALVGRASAAEMGQSLGVVDAPAVATVWEAVSTLTSTKDPENAQLTLAQWQLIGVDNLSSDELNWLNDAVANNADKSNYAVSDLKALVELAREVMTNDNPAITHQQFASLGVANIDSAEQASLLNNIITKVDADAVGDLGKLQKFATSVNRVLDGTSDPSANKDDYGTLGIIGVTTENLAKVSAAIAASGSSKATLGELQEVVNGGLKVYSLEVINNASAGVEGATPPTDIDFTQAGIDIPAGSVSEAMATIGRYKSESDYTSEQFTSLLNAHANLVAATSKDAAVAPTLLTPNELADLGVPKFGSTVSDKVLEVLAQVIDGRALSDVNTTEQLQALADVVERWVALVDDTIADPDPVMTPAEFALMGLDAVTTIEQAAFVTKVTANKGLLKSDTLGEISTLDIALKHMFSSIDEGGKSLSVAEIGLLGLGSVDYINLNNVQSQLEVNVDNLAAVQSKIFSIVKYDLDNYNDNVVDAINRFTDDFDALKQYADASRPREDLVDTKFNDLKLDKSVVNYEVFSDLLLSDLIASNHVDSWLDIQALVIAANKIEFADIKSSQTLLTAEALAKLGRAALTDSDEADVNAIVTAAAKVMLSVSNSDVTVMASDLETLGVANATVAGLVSINASTELTAVDTWQELYDFSVI